MKLPQLNIFSTHFPDGFLGSQNWIYPNKTSLYEKIVKTNRMSLLPSLDNDILYVDKISATFNRTIEEGTGNTNYVTFSKLYISPNNNVELLLNPIDSIQTIDTLKSTQTIEYLSERTPLFKINNLDTSRTINITFNMFSKDSYDKPFIESIRYIFYLNLKTIKGDINGDGKVDLMDVVALYNHIQSGDENYTSKDIEELSKYILENG